MFTRLFKFKDDYVEELGVSVVETLVLPGAYMCEISGGINKWYTLNNKYRWMQVDEDRVLKKYLLELLMRM